MKLLITWLINAVALIITSYLVKGFHIADFPTALVAAIIIGIINTFIKPILLILTAPINLLTLGLFTFVINAIVLWLASLFLNGGLIIEGKISGIVAAIVLSVVSTVLSILLKDFKK